MKIFAATRDDGYYTQARTTATTRIIASFDMKGLRSRDRDCGYYAHCFKKRCERITSFLVFIVILIKLPLKKFYSSRIALGDYHRDRDDAAWRRSLPFAVSVLRRFFLDQVAFAPPRAIATPGCVSCCSSPRAVDVLVFELSVLLGTAARLDLSLLEEGSARASTSTTPILTLLQSVIPG